MCGGVCAHPTCNASHRPPRTHPTHPCNGCIGIGVGRRGLSESMLTIQSAESWEYKYRPVFRVSDGWRRFCDARLRMESRVTFSLDILERTSPPWLLWGGDTTGSEPCPHSVRLFPSMESMTPPQGGRVPAAVRPGGGGPPRVPGPGPRACPPAPPPLGHKGPPHPPTPPDRDAHGPRRGGGGGNSHLRILREGTVGEGLG